MPKRMSDMHAVYMKYYYCWNGKGLSICGTVLMIYVSKRNEAGRDGKVARLFGVKQDFDRCDMAELGDF